MRRPFSRLRTVVFRHANVFTISCVALCAFVVVTTVHLAGQGCQGPGAPLFCHEGYDYSPHDLAGFVKTVSASCTEDGGAASNEDLPSGTFYKYSAQFPLQVRTDARDEVGGKCKLYIDGNYWPPDAVRYMVTIQLNRTGPNGGGDHQNVWGLEYLQMFDTRIPNTTLFPLDSLTQQGQYTYVFQGQSEGVCDWPNYSGTVTKTLNSMACKPVWYGEQDHINYHAPAGPITIALPTAFAAVQSSAEAAAADWGSALGRTIRVEPNSTCSPTDPLCVTFRNDHGTLPDDPEGCASFQGSSPNPDGTWIGPGAIRFEPVWTGADSTVYRRRIAHELGHYFGLWNRLDGTCNVNETIMGPPNATGCYQSTPLTNQLLGPSASDASALLNSTYGNHTRRVCGW